MRKNYLNNPGALKIDLMLRGIRIEDPIARAWACGGGGIDIMLPQNTLVNIPCSEEFTANSPYLIRKAGEGRGGRGGRGEGAYVITDGKGAVHVSLVEKPEFYSGKTSSGIPFPEIASARGAYTVITPSPRCDFFNSKVECRYCAGNFNTEGRPSAAFPVEDVLETVEAVLREKNSGIIYLSMGFSEGDDGGIEFLKPYMKAIKKHFSCLLAVEALPPRENRWIDETYALGADSVLYNLEIFDKELFEIICPGRAKLIGRKRYLDALSYAAKVFPNGTVASHLIVGLEPPGSTCMGVDCLTDMGVIPILPVYRPGKGMALRIEPLTAEIIIPVYKHLYKTVKAKGINFKWVRDLSMVTTPIEGRLLMEEEGEKKSLFEDLYNTRIGRKAAWGLSTLRRKLRVKEVKGPQEGKKH